MLCGLSFCEITGLKLYPEQGGLNNQPPYLQPDVLGMAHSWLIPLWFVFHTGVHVAMFLGRSMDLSVVTINFWRHFVFQELSHTLSLNTY